MGGWFKSGAAPRRRSSRCQGSTVGCPFSPSFKCPRPTIAVQALGAASAPLTGGGSSVGRCFRRAHLCRFDAFWDNGFVAAMRFMAKHYGGDVADPRPWDGAEGPDVLRVVFASRPSNDARSMLNEKEVLEACNAWVANDTTGEP